MTPALQTARLYLVPYTAGMVTDEHVAWLNDPVVVRYSEQRHVKHTIESQHVYLNSFPIGSHIWLIKLGGNGGSHHLGTITAYVDEHNRTANMGILLARNTWGNGIGTEAWRCVMDFLFTRITNFVCVRKIEAGCHLYNDGMIMLARRCKMRIEAIIPEHFILDGETGDMVLFGAFAP